MDTKHRETVKRESAEQARGFGHGGPTLARADCLRWMVASSGPRPRRG